MFIAQYVSPTQVQTQAYTRFRREALTSSIHAQTLGLTSARCNRKILMRLQRSLRKKVLIFFLVRQGLLKALFSLYLDTLVSSRSPVEDEKS